MPTATTIGSMATPTRIRIPRIQTAVTGTTAATGPTEPTATTGSIALRMTTAIRRVSRRAGRTDAIATRTIRSAIRNIGTRTTATTAVTVRRINTSSRIATASKRDTRRRIAPTAGESRTSGKTKGGSNDPPLQPQLSGARHQHRHSLTVAHIRAAVFGDQVTLLELNRDQDVSSGGDRKHEVRD